MRKKEIQNKIKEFARNELISKTTIPEIIEGKEISFTMKGIKEAISQNHDFYDAKNQAIFDIVNLIKNSIYIKSAKEEKGNPMIKQYHYLEIIIENEKSYIVIREQIDGVCSFYSIVDKCR